MNVSTALSAPVRQLSEEVGMHVELHGDFATFITNVYCSSDSWVGAFLARHTPENRGAVVATQAAETGN